MVHNIVSIYMSDSHKVCIRIYISKDNEGFALAAVCNGFAQTSAASSEEPVVHTLAIYQYRPR